LANLPDTNFEIGLSIHVMFGPINNIWPGGSEEIYFKSTDNKRLVIYGELKKKKKISTACKDCNNN
jgi:hypothetical protein